MKYGANAICFLFSERDKKERERVCERERGGEERNINLKRERYIFS